MLVTLCSCECGFQPFCPSPTYVACLHFRVWLCYCCGVIKRHPASLELIFLNSCSYNNLCSDGATVIASSLSLLTSLQTLDLRCLFLLMFSKEKELGFIFKSARKEGVKCASGKVPRTWEESEVFLGKNLMSFLND